MGNMMKIMDSTVMYESMGSMMVLHSKVQQMDEMQHDDW